MSLIDWLFGRPRFQREDPLKVARPKLPDSALASSYEIREGATYLIVYDENFVNSKTLHLLSKILDEKLGITALLIASGDKDALRLYNLE